MLQTEKDYLRAFSEEFLKSPTRKKVLQELEIESAPYISNSEEIFIGVC